MTWASQVLDYLSSIQNGVNISNLTSINFENVTAHGNKSLIGDIYMGGTGILGIQISDLAVQTIFSMSKNDTYAYINSGTALDPGCHYIFDLYVNESDKINFKTNQSTTFQFDLYWRKG